MVLVHTDLQSERWRQLVRFKSGQKLLANMPSQQLGRRIGDGQDHTIFPRENPAAILKSRLDLRVGDVNRDRWMTIRQQNMMIERLGDGLQDLQEIDEIDDVMVRIQLAADFRPYLIVVPVNALAKIIAEGDKMSGAEDQ